MSPKSPCSTLVPTLPSLSSIRLHMVFSPASLEQTGKRSGGAFKFRKRNPIFHILQSDMLPRIIAMLAGVPLALARNMPGAGPANVLILSMLTPQPPPRRLGTLRSWVQPPLRPSSQKQWYLQCFLHYRAVKPR